MANALILRPLPFVGVAADLTAAGFDPGNVGTDYMGVVWRSSPAATADILVDLGQDTNCDTALLLGCDGATAGWTLQVLAGTAAANDTTSWAGPVLPFLAGAAMPMSGRGIAIWRAPAVGGPPPARFWRFRIGGLAGGSATIARIALGRAIALQRNFQFGAAFGVKDQGSVDFSRTGVMLRRRGAKLRTVGLTFPAMTRAEVDAAVQPMLEMVGNTEPVGLITDPSEDPMRQRRIYFGPLVGDLGTIWRKAAAWQAGCNLVSLV